MADYDTLTVERLKVELLKRNASTCGRKSELINRLQAYDHNLNFCDEEIPLPENILSDWPSTGFKQMSLECQSFMPTIDPFMLKRYFNFRQGNDNVEADVKALERGRRLVDGFGVESLSYQLETENDTIHFTALVHAAMKTKVTYTCKLKLQSGEIINSDCECPAGKGPHGTCKHIAAIAIILQEFSETGEIKVKRTSTKVLQSSHKPALNYTGTPMKASQLPSKRVREALVDPRPLRFRKMPGYNDYVRNLTINYCAVSGADLTIRYLYPAADLVVATADHDYLELPFTDYWIDSNQV